jgi:hypothetical protein
MKKALPFIFISMGILISLQTTQAIPAFARKYSMSCMTCHNPVPRLKPYGDSFAGAGFRLADKEAPRYYQETGDRLLSLVRDFPLAVRMDGYLTYEDLGDDARGSDLKAPFLMKLLSGGAISDRISYYFYFYLFEQGEVAGVEDAYLMYNDLFNIDLDIYVGQFQVSDPMFKRELRLTLEDYHIYTVTPGISNINLGYEKGVMITLGTNFGMTVVGEVVNGNGIGEADEKWRFDKDKYKDFMGRISQDIGDFATIGAFAYYGKEKLLPGEDIPSLNEAFLWGPDLSIQLKKIIQLNVQYVQRSDSRVLVASDDEFMEQKDIATYGAIGELIFTPKGDDSRWYLVGLYNLADSDMDMFDYESATFHAGYLLRRNIRLISEFTYRFETNTTDPAWRTSLGFVSAF